MNLDNLLKYQEADLACKKLLDEIRGNSDYLEMKKYKNEFNIAKQKVSDSETLASTVISAYSGANEYLEKIHAGRKNFALCLKTKIFRKRRKRPPFPSWSRYARLLPSGKRKPLS